jgi:hypothetical protein
MIMKPKLSFAVAAATVLIWAVTGGETSQSVGGSEPSLAEGQTRATPFLSRDDYPESLGLVMSDVLAKHRFSIPWIGVRGPEDSMWFISERFQSEHQFDRIYVQVRPDEHVTARITGYQRVGSSWAILGKIFVDYRPEADSISEEISKALVIAVE